MDHDTIEESEILIEQMMREYRNPVLMCSFGKDSMVLLHLMRDLQFKIPVIFHREPFMPAKYQFANQIINRWNLTVYDYPAARTTFCKRQGKMEVLNEYQIGAETCMVPTGIMDPEPGQEYLCALKDLLYKPLGTFNYPWDLCFIGHKSSDVDPLHGKLEFEIDVKRNLNSAHFAFPLRKWSDKDIWDYIEEYGVPYHQSRYEKVGNTWMEKLDRTYNPDYFPACTACIDRDQPATVHCPKLGRNINNLSSRIAYQEPQFDYIKKE
jgi:hypothetical protein